MNQDIFQNKISIFDNPEIQKCINIIEKEADYKISSIDNLPFLYFHNFITKFKPKFLYDWQRDTSQCKWYHLFINNFLIDTRNSFLCVLYHYDNLLKIEKNVLNLISQTEYKKYLPQGSTIALSNTLVWDFEYQAFILAFRRCLDSLTRSLASYFKENFHSYREMQKKLKNKKPEFLAKALIEVHNKYQDKFSFVLSDGERKSTRDRISHYKYVNVGCINLSNRGFELVGGGENLGFKKNELLAEVLKKYVDELKSCIKETIFTFIDNLKKQNETSTSSSN